MKPQSRRYEKKYSPELIERLGDLYELKKVNVSYWKEISDILSKEFGLNITQCSAKSLHQRYCIPDHPQQSKPYKEQDDFMGDAVDIIHRKKKTVQEITLPEILDGFIERQSFHDNFSIRQLTAEPAINTKKPIALTFLSDVHVGSPHTDYEGFLSDVEKIMSCERHYVALGGDLADNFSPNFKNKAAAVWQLEPPQIQLLTEEKIIEYLRGRIIAKIGGNHDKMIERDTGVSAQYFIMRNKPFPYLPEGGLIKLLIGDIEYKIIWKHHYRFNSSLNKFNTHHRMIEMLVPDADIAVTEHEHSPGIESTEVGEYDARRTQIGIRTGAYKLDDPYSMAYWKAGRIAPQTVILWPDKKKILALHGRDAIEDAQTYLKGLG